MTKEQKLRKAYLTLVEIAHDETLTEQEYVDVHAAMRRIDYMLWPSVTRDERDK